MWFQFFLENSHFAINLIAALVCFSVVWLYFDAWMDRMSPKEGYKALGFLILSTSFLIHAVYLESTLVESPIINKTLHFYAFLITRITGYLLIIIGLLIDPLPKVLQNPGLQKADPPKAFFGANTPSATLSLLLPLLSATIALLFWRRSTTGLERHLKGISLSFAVITLSEILFLLSLLKDSQNPVVYNLVAPFSSVWILEHLTLLTGILILGRWIFGYLLKRIQTQLFIILTTTILIIFLLTTTAFTLLLLKNFQQEAFLQLEANVKIISLSVNSKKEELVSDSKVIALNTEVLGSLESSQSAKLSQSLQNFLLNKKQQSLVVVNNNGQVIGRGEDASRIGDSLSEDPFVKQALSDKPAVAVSVKEGVLAPGLSLKTAVSVKNGDQVIGAVVSESLLDNTFVDGIKNATGLEISIFGRDTLSATTLSLSETSRGIGVKEKNLQLLRKVLEEGQSFTGSVEIFNRPYFASFLPLYDIQNKPIGMLSAYRPQAAILRSASASIELTYIICALLIVISIFPAYLISKYIFYQLR